LASCWRRLVGHTEFLPRLYNFDKRFSKRPEMIFLFNKLSLKAFKAIKKQFLQQGLDYQEQHKNAKLLSCCRPTISLDPILWLPMHKMVPWMAA
jgi:L-2-hydroxyglutarate oxidase LhgO